MALRVFQFAVTIPAGTPKASPVTVALPIDNWEMESLDLEVPAGPSGVMGFYIANNGAQWIPASPGSWLIWDDVQQSWPFSDQPNASGWQVVGYNTGTYPHVVTVRMHVNPPTPAQQSGVAPQLVIQTTAVAPLPVTVL